MSRLNELRYNHLKFDLKFSWRGVYRPPQRAQQVKNGPSVPGLGEEREVDFAMRKRKKVWEKPGLELGPRKNSQQSHWTLASSPGWCWVQTSEEWYWGFFCVVLVSDWLSWERRAARGWYQLGWKHNKHLRRDLVLNIGRSVWLWERRRGIAY